MSEACIGCTQEHVRGARARPLNNTLLVPKGFAVTATFVERICNFGPELLTQHLRVLVRATRPI